MFQKTSFDLLSHSSRNPRTLKVYQLKYIYQSNHRDMGQLLFLYIFLGRTVYIHSSLDFSINKFARQYTAHSGPILLQTAIFAFKGMTQFVKIAFSIANSIHRDTFKFIFIKKKKYGGKNLSKQTTLEQMNINKSTSKQNEFMLRT